MITFRSILKFLLADDQRWLFTGILPNLYHPPERLALKSDIAGSLLVTDQYFSEQVLMKKDLFFRDRMTQKRFQNQLVLIVNNYLLNFEIRFA